ncbi:MAG: hypothetical protein CMB80_08180 [Flammeovirgaceae bacterium]|jgi:hypothetical protein|nr:hypothetical protein [Flammeovirgaceae bacterium]|tara:strand:- start:765 stop:1250 length:486 start_codon:yes stop_codon:yes gene_type:complete
MTRKNLDNIPPGETKCSVCGVIKSNTVFSWYKHRLTKDGYRLRANTYCDPCAKATRKEVDEIKKVLLKDHPRPEYGESCDLCGKPVWKEKDGIKNSWQCDHEHGKIKFRGWICKPCNTGLGKIGDSPETVIKVLYYLLEKPDIDKFKDQVNHLIEEQLYDS